MGLNEDSIDRSKYSPCVLWSLQYKYSCITWLTVFLWYYYTDCFHHYTCMGERFFMVNFILNPGKSNVHAHVKFTTLYPMLYKTDFLIGEILYFHPWIWQHGFMHLIRGMCGQFEKNPHLILVETIHKLVFLMFLCIHIILSYIFYTGCYNHIMYTRKV